MAVSPLQKTSKRSILQSAETPDIHREEEEEKEVVSKKPYLWVNVCWDIINIQCEQQWSTALFS